MAQRVVAFQAAPRADQQPEPVIKTITHFTGGHRRHPGGGQFDGQWNPVQALTNLDDCGGFVAVDHREARRNALSAFDEQTHRRRVDSRCRVQRAHRPNLLVWDSESLAAGGEDSYSRRLRKYRFDQVGGGGENVLAIVDHQQPDPALQRGGHRLTYGLTRLLGDAQHRRHRIGHRRRISHRCQLEKPNAVGKLISQVRRDFQRQTGLADPTHPGQRHQPMRLDRRFDLGDHGLASDQAGGRRPQISRRRIECPQRRETPCRSPAART